MIKVVENCGTEEEVLEKLKKEYNIYLGRPAVVSRLKLFQDNKGDRWTVFVDFSLSEEKERVVENGGGVGKEAGVEQEGLRREVP